MKHEKNTKKNELLCFSIFVFCMFLLKLYCFVFLVVVWFFSMFLLLFFLGRGGCCSLKTLVGKGNSLSSIL